MENIDRRIKYMVVFDTETAGTLGAPLIYDLGMTITDKRGKIYEQGSWIIQEVFDNKKLMEKAYYGKKYKMYQERIAKGELTKVPFKVAKAEFNALLEKWNVKALLAYNIGFDLRALKASTRYLHSQFAENENRDFILQELEIQDIWGFACETLYTQKSFHKLVEQEGWFTPSKNPLTNAEVGYRFISKDREFEEKHTALNDSEIETAIMAKCYRMHKKFTKGIKSQPWREVAKLHKEYLEKVAVA